jgi:ASC-1-like (ASCH) protein
MNKTPQDKILTDDKIADIDMYSPEPISDWYNICNLLQKNGFKYILGEEAQHQETYSIKVNRIVFCDISYVPKNIYVKMPFVEINGLQCIHPNFATIDFLRMTSDPLVSYWRFFECSEELKAFKRFYKLQKNYQLPYNDRKLQMDKPKEKIQKANEIIFNFLQNKKTTITTGFYAYNYLCHSAGFDYVYIPFFEFISIDYRNDALELLDLLKKEFNDSVSIDEYYPFFQFTDYSVEIYIDNEITCRIYGNNKKCVQYQDVPVLNFFNDKVTKTSGKIRIGSYTNILLFFLIETMKQRVKNDKDMEKYYFHVVSHCVQSKNKYLRDYKKTYLDDTIFKEFDTECIGEGISAEKERMLLIEKRKKNKEPLVYRYDPKDEKAPPKFKGFKNTSGNKINNPKNLKLSEKENNDDEYDDEEESKKENSENNQTGGEIYYKNVKQPYFAQIKEGRKTHEGRLNKGDFAKLKVGDFIIWENNDKEDKSKFKTIITSIMNYKTFVGAITDIGLDKILPSQFDDNIPIIQAVENVYRKFYSKEDEDKYGVLMIELENVE